MNWFYKFLVVVFVLYFVAAIALYYMQGRMMFGPDKTRILAANSGVAGLLEVMLETPKGLKLYSWYVPAKPNKPVLLFFHGNGGNVSYRIDKFLQLSEQGYGVFMLGYRGFGGSDGSPSEKVFIFDARLAYDYLIGQGVKADDIIIYGESIGSSVAVQLATKVKSAAVILEAPMFSVLSIAESLYPFVPVRYFLRDKFETDQYIKFINAPLLIVHGSDDEIIPLASGRRLFDEAVEPKQFETLEGAAHNNLYEFPTLEKIVQFIDGLRV